VAMVSSGALAQLVGFPSRHRHLRDPDGCRRSRRAVGPPDPPRVTPRRGWGPVPAARGNGNTSAKLPNSGASKSANTGGQLAPANDAFKAPAVPIPGGPDSAAASTGVTRGRCRTAIRTQKRSFRPTGWVPGEDEFEESPERGFRGRRRARRVDEDEGSPPVGAPSGRRFGLGRGGQTEDTGHRVTGSVRESHERVHIDDRARPSTPCSPPSS